MKPEPQSAGGAAGRAAAVTLAQLESFAALARWRKQAAAQAALGKSQSQISRDLAALERSVGMHLLDRRGRALTAAGRRLLDYAVEVLRGWDGLRAGAEGQAGGIGRVGLAAEPEVIGGALVPILGDLRHRYPGMDIRLVARSGAQLAGLLSAGEADVAVLPGATSPGQGLAVRPFLTGRVFVVVPVRWAAARRPSVSLAALRGRMLLVPPPGSSLREAVDSAITAAGVRGAVLSEAGLSPEVVIAAAAAGLGAGFVLVFDGAGDRALNVGSADVKLRPTGKEFPRVRYQVAIRKTLQPAGIAALLVRELLRVVRPSHETAQS